LGAREKEGGEGGGKGCRAQQDAAEKKPQPKDDRQEKRKGKAARFSRAGGENVVEGGRGRRGVSQRSSPQEAPCQRSGEEEGEEKNPFHFNFLIFIMERALGGGGGKKGRCFQLSVLFSGMRRSRKGKKGGGGRENGLISPLVHTEKKK